MAASRAQIELKREYGKRQKELKKKLFEEVEQKLQEYMKTDEYKRALVRYIEKALRMFSGSRTARSLPFILIRQMRIRRSFWKNIPA